MLKGKTTIQLFDAKTGEKTDEVTKTNLVTNAVRNILGGAFNQLASGNDWASGMRYINSLYKLPEGKNFAQALYGGVLIFSKPITEDVDHCLPTVEEIKTFICSANQSASDGSDSFRGSINSGESEVGTDYVKFVWDFKTNECNGDIASVCLTSDCGGVMGYGCDVIKDYYKNTSLRTFNYSGNSCWSLKSSSLYFGQDKGNKGVTGALVDIYQSVRSSSEGIEGYYSYIDGDYLNMIKKGIDYRQNISRFISKDKFGLSIVDGFNSGLFDASDSLSIFESIDTGVVEDGYIPYTSKNCAYALDSGSSYSEFKLIKYYGAGLAERITIPASNINSAINEYFGDTRSNNYLSNQNKVVHKDKLYVITGQLNYKDQTAKPNKLRVWVLNFDGTYTYKDVAITDKFVTLFAGNEQIGGSYNSSLSQINQSFGEYRGSLYFEAPSGYKFGVNDKAHFLLDDDGTMQTHPFMICSKSNSYGTSNNSLCYNFIDNIDFIPNPYITISKLWLKNYDDSTYYWNNLFYTPLLVTAYLGTINNQETVLTKTADKTMKIIYTLTQA